MRAQLRTYHAIPSLQAHQDAHAYKQLQDAPRLKSILKGGAEDRTDPTTLWALKDMDAPRTNPVNLIFVMCNEAAKVAELHFPQNFEFHDLVMKTKYTSKSRARAFLWLMWFHLESDFTEEGCWENPFGAGVDYGLGVANQGIPTLEKIDDGMEPENVDTPEEIEFGREKQKTRARILEMDLAYLNERENRRGKIRAPYPPDGNSDGPAILPRIRPSKHESDMDSTRSTPPPKGGRASQGGGRGRGAPLKYQLYEGGSSPARGGSGSAAANAAGRDIEGSSVVTRKPRPPTAHQLAVERNRHERVEHILDRGLRRQHHKSRRARRQDGAVFRAYRRAQAAREAGETPGFPDESEDDEATPTKPRNVTATASQPFRETGVTGLRLLGDDKDDFGEEVSAYAAALRRATRRLARWAGHEAELGVIAPVKRKKAEDPEAQAAANGEQEQEQGAGADEENDADNDKTMNGDVDVDDSIMPVGARVRFGATNGGGGGADPDVTMDDEMDIDEVDATAVMGDDERGPEDEGDDPDRTEVMADGESEGE